MNYFFSILLLVSSACAQLTFDKAVIEVTAKPDEDSLVVDFPFVNNTANEQNISSVNSYCSCLEVKATSQKVAVGEKGVLRATLDIKNLHSTVSKTAEVHLAGSDKPQHITVKATIPELVNIEPRSLQWSFTEPRKAKTVRVTMNHDAPIQLLSAKSVNTAFTCEKRTVEEGKIYEITVTPPQEQITAAVFGRLQIETDCKYTRHKNKECFVLLRPKDR
jgi:Protein of unknown function (DUF1573)